MEEEITIEELKRQIEALKIIIAKCKPLYNLRPYQKKEN